MPFLQIPAESHYWLSNARVPLTLLTNGSFNWPLVEQFQRGQYRESLVAVDIEVRDGTVGRVQPAIAGQSVEVPTVDAQSGLIWPCFVDMHTHLDKGHIWSRSPNPDGTFEGALKTVQQDRAQRWQAEDIYRRMAFGLKCSYAHGTQAVRTHLDALDGQGEISFEVFRQLRKEWKNKIFLQAACLVSLDYFIGQKGEKLADLVADSSGVLGGVAYMNPNVVQQIDRIFELAKERGLDLDFHTDESLDASDITLRYVAEAAIRHQFTGQITCGHCCSLSVQSESEAHQTIAAVKQASVAIVSLPMCNLYLQDRQPERTPRYRGVTILRELKAAGVKCALASDNCRDPFFAYGDHDGLEVFTQSVRIAQLDHPIDDWAQSVTSVPAEMMGLRHVGKIGEGLAADFVLFKARSFNELLARGQSDRTVIRQGKQIDTTLPDYAELDDLMR
ncbi:MAG: cytosine deaminase [Phormidesmis sp.]